MSVEQSLRAQDRFHAPVQILDAVRSLSQCGQDPKPAERGERGGGIALGQEGAESADCCLLEVLRKGGGRGERFGCEVGALRSGCDRECGGCIAHPHGFTKAVNGAVASEAVIGSQRGKGGTQRTAWLGGGIGDVGQNASRIDRGELVAVAEQDDASTLRHGIEEACHEGKRHHGGLVDHDEIDRERMARVMFEIGRIRARPEESVQRGGTRNPGCAFGRGRSCEPGPIFAHGLFEPRRGLPGWSRERDARAGRHLQQLGENAHNGCGLAGAGPARDDREFACERGGDGRVLVIAGDRLRITGAIRRAMANMRGQSLFVVVVPAQIEPSSSVEHQRRAPFVFRGGDGA